MTKVIAVIPARLGSTRIPKKNVRLLNGIPLISYAIRAAKEANCFDEIYVNTESDLIGKIALEEGVKFYKRSTHLTTDEATNDDFTLDFLQNIKCDTLVQILATSPFISPTEINNFTNSIVATDTDTLITVYNQQIECVYNEAPINFDQKLPSPPSQTLTPIGVYACALMGWKSLTYQENMRKYGSGYHGGDGKISFFELKGYSTIDIDNEEDFLLAELVAQHLTMPKETTPRYYTGLERVESDVPSILVKDGVLNNDLHSANSETPVNVKEIIEGQDSSTSWSKRVVNTDSNSATLILQQPGEGNRDHYHPDWNEWWYIVDGQWEWNIEGETFIVAKDDIVFIPKGKVHHITAVGDKPAIRLAVSREDVPHIYVSK